MASGRSDEKVEKIFRGLANLPSLPEAIQKMVELSADKEATPRQFAALISADQGLTVKVLKLVNSAFHGLSQSIASVHHATTLLGVKTLKSLVLSVSVMQLFRKGCDGFHTPRYWQHSVAVAVAAQRLGLKLREGFEDHCYIAGLMHDVGTALLAEHLAAEYSLVLRLYRETERELCEIEEEVFGVSHAVVGSRLVTKWQVPKLIGDAISKHELDSQAIGDVPPKLRELLDIVRMAETVVSNAGYGFLDGTDRAVAEATGEPISIAEPSELQIPDWVEISPEAIVDTVGDLRAEVARMEVLLGSAMDREPRPVH